MKKSKQPKHFIKKPTYPGGMTAIRKFVGDNLKYPQAALDNKIAGKVKINYTINHKGKVIDAKVFSGLGHGCDEEALRIVRLLRFEVPKNRGVKVKFHKKITINFHLPKQKIQKAAQKKIQYHITPAKKTTANSYTITIQYPQ